MEKLFQVGCNLLISSGGEDFNITIVPLERRMFFLHFIKFKSPQPDHAWRQVKLQPTHWLFKEDVQNHNDNSTIWLLSPLGKEEFCYSC